MNKTLQAKHVDEEKVLALIDRIQQEEGRWTLTFDLEAAFPDIPLKVLRAKMAALIKRKVINGCACGCRGDFERVAFVVEQTPQGVLVTGTNKRAS